MRFSSHAMQRLRERYGLKWTVEIESEVTAQWKAMKGRDPDPRTDGRGCIWYTFTAGGQDVRLLVDIHTKKIVTCGPPEFLADPLARPKGKKLPRRQTPRKMDNRRPRIDFDNTLDTD